MDTQSIKKQVDLLALIGRDTALTKVANTRGGEYAGPCPFCGGHDRLRVQPEQKRWFCRQCTGTPGDGGHWQDAIAYVMKRDRLNFKAALNVLNNGAVLSVTFKAVAPSPHISKPLPNHDWQGRARIIMAESAAALWGAAGIRARNWLHQRGLNDDTLRIHELGYNPVGRKIAGLWVERGIVIPWVVENKVYKLNVRRPVKRKNEEKYKAVSGSINGALYLADLLTGLPDVFITEGEFDALLLWQLAKNLADVLTLGSATGRLSDGWLPYLLAGKHFFIATDNDTDGNKAAEYWLGLVGERGKRTYLPGRAKDITDAWKSGLDIPTWVRCVQGGTK